jgi:iron-sulfur cluster insertion protein
MTITESAQTKVDNTLNGEGFLGIHLEGGGCSGYQIKLSPSTDIPSDAQMLSDTIFSDPTSLELLGDAEMDWIDDPFRPTFHFTPPTGSSSCGCGSSFQID